MENNLFKGSKILLAEDEETLAVGLEYNLTDEGFAVDWAKDGKEALNFFNTRNYDLIILDKILVSIHFGLFNDEEVMTFMKMKPENVELILTGRYCPDKILEAADLVTEMKVIKHYYQEGILARQGIES